MLSVRPIKTEIYESNNDFNNFLYQSLKDQDLESKILAVTSKVISIAENEVVKKDTIEKEALIRKEADYYIGKTLYDCHLTIKHGLIIPSAGIDESNVSGDSYLLFPKQPFVSAQKIYNFIKAKFNLNNFGVIVTDSKTVPLKKGVVGTCLAYHGFSGLNNKVGAKDLYGTKLEHTQVNICEALAAAATLQMGEANECQPLAIIEAQVKFHNCTTWDEQRINPEEDIYYPILMNLLQN